MSRNFRGHGREADSEALGKPPVEKRQQQLEIRGGPMTGIRPENNLIQIAVHSLINNKNVFPL